jgi:putative transposase
MPNTYTQLYTQLIFAVKGRKSLIKKEWKSDLYKYITGIVQNKQFKMIQINGMSDHIHIFVGQNPKISVSEIVKDIKIASNLWLNNRYVKGFQWQEGYGAFSYSRSQIQDVCHYIENQESHHKKQNFKDEYISFLKAFEVDYNENYLFEFIEDPYSTPTES